MHCFCDVRSAGVGYLRVPVVFRKAPPHHVGHSEGLDSQQVEDHRVGESELGLEEGRFTLNHNDEADKRDVSAKLLPTLLSFTRALLSLHFFHFTTSAQIVSRRTKHG